jgi:transposase
MQWLQDKYKKSDVIVGIEPTGHYWFDLGAYLEDGGILLVMVNPYAVKQTKELDDNSQSKNDCKDPKVIAKLVIDGRYSAPYSPDGVYADLRIMTNNRRRLVRELNQIKNRIARWFAIYFPEYLEIFGDYESKSSMLLLKEACTPEAILALGAEGVNQIWRREKLRAVGIKRATSLCEAAKRSIGLKKGSLAAEIEMKMMLQDYEYKLTQLDYIMDEIERLCKQIPESEQLLAIKGIGLITVAGFLGEIGDVRRFESPKQIQKLAGLSLRENSSGKHKGQTTISKRGRSKLRAILFQAVIPLVAKNPEFRSLHKYYTTRQTNPLKKKQSIIAISCKLIRIFYAILKNNTVYDPQKMLSDIHRHPSAA